MTIAWMLYVLLVGTLLSVGAWGVEDAFRFAKLPTRWIWVTAMLGTLGFAAYAIRGASAPTTVNRAFMARVTTSVGAVAPPANRMATSIDAMRSVIASSIASATARVPARVARWALLAWAAWSASLLLMHIAVSRRVVRQRNGWPHAALPGGAVRVAPALGPAVVGLGSPEIVVPQWLLEKTSEEQRIVLVHEQEHIAARDQYLPVAALLVATLLPWHPALWWSLARLRLAVELDCDARVLRRGIAARPYGSLLIDIAGQCAGHRVGALALADRPTHLERRLRAMDTRTTQFNHPRAALLGLLAMAAIATACESRMPTATEVSRLSGAGAQKLVAEAASMDPSARQAVYVVDGVQVTSARVEVLPEDSIATIEISRAPVMKVKITTKAMLASQGKVVSGGELHAVLDGTVISAEATQRIIAKPPVPAVYSKRKTSTPSFPTTAALPQPRSNGPTPVMIIDDRVATEAQFAALTPAEILTVNVFKGAAAESRYGVALEKLPGAPAGALASNGVIVVATKRAVSR